MYEYECGPSGGGGLTMTGREVQLEVLWSRSIGNVIFTLHCRHNVSNHCWSVNIDYASHLRPHTLYLSVSRPVWSCLIRRLVRVLLLWYDPLLERERGCYSGTADSQSVLPPPLCSRYIRADNTGEREREGGEHYWETPRLLLTSVNWPGFYWQGLQSSLTHTWLCALRHSM